MSQRNENKSTMGEFWFQILAKINLPIFAEKSTTITSCRGSVVEHLIGNEEVESSILSGSTKISYFISYLFNTKVFICL